VPDVRLLGNAERDLRRIGPGPQRKRIAAALAALRVDMANLAIKALAGTSPWRRLRVGDYRVLYRPRPDNAHEVGRIVHRGDLDKAAANFQSLRGRS
jgi:mRNA-degrading endonuclease RelE of RelBE toxin-antitoxin system